MEVRVNGGDLLNALNAFKQVSVKGASALCDRFVFATSRQSGKVTLIGGDFGDYEFYFKSDIPCSYVDMDSDVTTYAFHINEIVNILKELDEIGDVKIVVDFFTIKVMVNGVAYFLHKVYDLNKERYKDNLLDSIKCILDIFDKSGELINDNPVEIKRQKSKFKGDGLCFNYIGLAPHKMVIASSLDKYDYMCISRARFKKVKDIKSLHVISGVNLYYDNERMVKVVCSDAEFLLKVLS